MLTAVAVLISLKRASPRGEKARVVTPVERARMGPTAFTYPLCGS